MVGGFARGLPPRQPRQRLTRSGRIRMSESNGETKGPDLTRGVPLAQIGESDMLLGHVGDEAVLVARSGGEVFAIGAPLHPLSRSARRRPRGRRHRALPLASRLLRSAHAARRCGRRRLSPVACWQVEQRDGRIFVTDKLKQPKPRAKRPAAPAAAANRDRRRRRGRLCRGRDAAAARICRQHHHAERRRRAPPVDRPNLSKDYLAGSAPEDWMPLRPTISTPRTASICV